MGNGETYSIILISLFNNKKRNIINIDNSLDKYWYQEYKNLLLKRKIQPEYKLKIQNDQIKLLETHRKIIDKKILAIKNEYYRIVYDYEKSLKCVNDYEK